MCFVSRFYLYVHVQPTRYTSISNGKRRWRSSYGRGINACQSPLSLLERERSKERERALRFAFCVHCSLFFFRCVLGGPIKTGSGRPILRSPLLQLPHISRGPSLCSNEKARLTTHFQSTQNTEEPLFNLPISPSH
jgi:hypothetical protein